MNHGTLSYKKPGNLLSAACLSLIFLSSCYSVRVINRDGIAETDPLHMTHDFYRGKKVHLLDTTITIKLHEAEFSLIEKCPSGGFYSFEYRVTLGDVLLGAVNLSKKRKVSIKYVCLKQ